MLVYGLNESYADIFCFSTTRHGGYSTGQYSSFNCNHYCGDSPENVERNRILLAEILPGRPKMLIVPHQVHSTVVRTIDIRFLSASESERKNMLEGVDAVITNLPEVCVCVSTADCIPILCYDVRNKAVAAVHAGWREDAHKDAGRVRNPYAGYCGSHRSGHLIAVLRSRRRGISVFQ